MAFNDIWRCKRCNVLPEIEVRGKNFLIRCKRCNTPETQFFAYNLDEVVAGWNRKNDPLRRSAWSVLGTLRRRIKDAVLKKSSPTGGSMH